MRGLVVIRVSKMPQLLWGLVLVSDTGGQSHHLLAEFGLSEISLDTKLRLCRSNSDSISSIWSSLHTNSVLRSFLYYYCAVWSSFNSNQTAQSPLSYRLHDQFLGRVEGEGGGGRGQEERDGRRGRRRIIVVVIVERGSWSWRRKHHHHRRRRPRRRCRHHHHHRRHHHHCNKNNNNNNMPCQRFYTPLNIFTSIQIHSSHQIYTSTSTHIAAMHCLECGHEVILFPKLPLGRPCLCYKKGTAVSL